MLTNQRRQHKTRIFNVGNRRRLAQLNEDSAHPTDHDASFFDPNNAEYTSTRAQFAMETLEELLHWLLEDNGSVGILGSLAETSLRIDGFRCNKFDSGQEDFDPRTSSPDRRSQCPFYRKHMYRQKGKSHVHHAKIFRF